MSGHLLCTATLSMSRLISTLNYLRLADTCLTRTRTVIYWFSEPAITDSVNKYRVFGGHFNPRSLVHTLTFDRQFGKYSVFNPRCRRRERFLVWTSETQIASIEADRAGRVEFGRLLGLTLYVKHQTLTYVEYFVRVLFNEYIPQLLYHSI